LLRGRAIEGWRRPNGDRHEFARTIAGDEADGIWPCRCASPGSPASMGHGSASAGGRVLVLVKSDLPAPTPRRFSPGGCRSRLPYPMSGVWAGSAFPAFRLVASLRLPT